MPPSPPAVLLVDEDAILRRAVRDLLERDGLRVAGEAGDAEQGLALTLELEPDVVTMAVSMRGPSGIEGTRRIIEALPEARVVILTRSHEAADAAAAIGAGACGYLLKDDPPEEIVAGIRAAAEGASPLSPRIAGELLDTLRAGVDGSNGLGNPNGLGSPDDPELTVRELEVLGLLAEGRNNGEIASALSISTSTVKRHLTHLLVKLQASNRTQAAVEAVRRGLL